MLFCLWCNTARYMYGNRVYQLQIYSIQLKCKYMYSLRNVLIYQQLTTCKKSMHCCVKDATLVYTFYWFCNGGGVLICVCILTVLGASLINWPTNPNCDNNIHVNCRCRCLISSSLDMHVKKKKKKNMQKDIGDVASPPVYACDCLLILCPL